MIDGRTTGEWYAANQRYLAAALALVRDDLEGYAAARGEAGRGGAEWDEQGTAASAYGEGQRDALRADLEEAAAALPAPSALHALCERFELSVFERSVLLLCAGVELDASFARLCALAQDGAGQAYGARAYPTFGLALAALPGAHWSALTPAAPLRYWRLIEVQTSGGGPLTASPLRIDERILHYLAGASHIDERLAGLVEPGPPAGELVHSHAHLAERLVAAWSDTSGGPLPLVQLCGDDAAGKRAIASAACAALGLEPYILPALAIPAHPAELEALVLLWEREAALGMRALVLDCDDLDGADPSREQPAGLFAARLRSPLILISRERRRIELRASITLDVARPGGAEQRQIWERALAEGSLREPGLYGASSLLEGQVEALVSQFNLAPHAIAAAAHEALAHLAADARQRELSPAEAGRRLWDAARGQARPRMGDLAQRIHPVATWHSLVLPPEQRRQLHEIALQVRQRARVYDDWGFAALSARGLGISALFAGVSGTGKTMAAEVLANELRLDLYRIDLSQVVSKYIGQTEKNLRQVFDAAEDGGAILLFDEADALFGKRSEVKDSHDRYANIEVSYLLQRMEAYRGLAILTTNMKEALDPAFLRRLRFVVQFPFPDASARAEIWGSVFPSKTPTAHLDVARLARLTVTGGNIHNISLYAAFLAAEAGEPVTMAHLLRGAEAEYGKLERPLTQAEIGGWV